MVYLGFLAPLALAIAALLALCIGGFSVLSAVRTYVGGESMWSKARAQAVLQLRAHAVSGNQADYRRFTEALAVPLGDRAARLELDKRRPDWRVVEAGFLAGESVAEDIPGAIRLYRYFRHVDFMEEAVAAWMEGDRLIEQLQALGERIHGQVTRGDSPAALAPLIADLDALDARLVSVEKYFSATLGRASRKTQELLTGVTFVLAAVLAFGGAWFVRRTMRMQFADQQLLLEANQRWDLAAGAAGIGLFDWHVAEDRFELDERAAMLYGMGDGSAGAILKRTDLRAVTHPDDQPVVRRQLDEAVQSGGLFNARYRVQWPSGEIRHLEAIGRVREAAPLEQPRMVGIVRDVGPEVAQAQLAIEREAAERVGRLRVEFLSRLSHELRTPLNAVLGVAQLLRLDPLEPLSPTQAKRVKILQDSGEHLLRLIEDVLEVTRIDAAQLDTSAGVTDMLQAARAGLNAIEAQQASAQVRIEDRTPYNAVPVRADAERLQQVFAALLSSACRHSAAGGLITMSYREAGADACVQLHDEAGQLSADELAELAQPYRRMPADGSGPGLGMVAVKLLVEQMHGSLQAESEPGRGYRFSVKLPRQ